MAEEGITVTYTPARWVSERVPVLIIPPGARFSPVELERCITSMHTGDGVPDSTACTLEEWNAKVDALLAECGLEDAA